MNPRKVEMTSKVSWLDEIEKILQDEREFTENQIRKGYEETPEERMVRVLREAIWFIKMNIDFDSPLQPVGIARLSDDIKELLK